MNAYLHRFIVATFRKLLPESAAERPNTALALRQDAPFADWSPQTRYGAHPVTVYAPPVATPQPVHLPPPPTRRRTVTVTETVYIQKTGGLYE